MRRFGYNFSSLQKLGKILQKHFFLYWEKRLNRFGYMYGYQKITMKYALKKRFGVAGIKFDVICWPYIISERNYFAINYDQTVTKNIFQPTWCEEAMILSQSAHGRNCTVDETSRQVTCYIQTGLNECFVFSNTQNYLMPFTWNTNCEIQWHRPLAVTSHFHSYLRGLKMSNLNGINIMTLNIQ